MLAMSTTPDMAREIIAGNVRALIGRHRSSQTKLAQVLGMSQQALSRRLTAELPFDTDELVTIAAHFDGPIGDVIEGVDVPSDAESALVAF